MEKELLTVAELKEKNASIRERQVAVEVQPVKKPVVKAEAQAKIVSHDKETYGQIQKDEGILSKFAILIKVIVDILKTAFAGLKDLFMRLTTSIEEYEEKAVSSRAVDKKTDENSKISDEKAEKISTESSPEKTIEESMQKGKEGVLTEQDSLDKIRSSLVVIVKNTGVLLESFFSYVKKVYQTLQVNSAKKEKNVEKV
jgi:hypothetical protein